MKRRWIVFFVAATGLCAMAACKRPDAGPPPPDARRPVLKSESELADERAARVREGAVAAEAEPVVLEAEKATRAATTRPAPLIATPNDIQPDILMVNNTVLTVPDILYPLRDEIEKARKDLPAASLESEIARAVRRQVTQEIRFLLVYAHGMAGLGEPQKQSLEITIERRVDEQITIAFGGSTARFTQHLTRYSVTLESYTAALQREMLVRQYLRELFLPKITIRRDELIDNYRRNEARFSSPETRELLMIEAPFARFLPEGATWERASPGQRARAKLQAMRLIRRAHEALSDQPFDKVAREHSRGLHAETGGSWGQIGRPLQAPYETVSKLIFEYEQGKHSEPLETPIGWYIVGCGKIKQARKASFAQVQEELRNELMDRRFNELVSAYILRLAENATISPLDPFIAAAVRRATADAWPGGEQTSQEH